jgi:hypothetical protein
LPYFALSSYGEGSLVPWRAYGEGNRMLSFILEIYKAGKSTFDLLFGKSGVQGQKKLVWRDLEKANRPLHWI